MLDLPGIRSIGCATGVSSRACFAHSHPANTSSVAEVSPTSVGSTARTRRPSSGRQDRRLGQIDQRVSVWPVHGNESVTRRSGPWWRIHFVGFPELPGAPPPPPAGPYHV